MRIGIEVQRIFRNNKHGMEIVGVELMKELQQLDHNNQYVLFAKDGPDKDCIQETPNFKIQTFKSLTYADWEQITLPKVIKQERLDLLHCTCNTGPVFSPVPMMLTLHDIIYLENLNFKGSSYQNFGNIYRRIVVPKVVEKCEFIITVSEFEKKLIRERLEVPEEKVKVIYNGISRQFFADIDSETITSFRQLHELPSEFMLFLGNKAPKKNTVNVVKAYTMYCRMSKNPLPLVVLDIERQQMARVLRDLKSSWCLKNFHFPGYIQPAEMPLMYNAASIFLYPSLRESFGMPILEAMACKTPVITSNTSSMPEVAGDAALYVDPFSVEDIAKGIKLMCDNEQLRNNLVLKGQQRAKQFPWSAAATKVLELYNRIAK